MVMDMFYAYVEMKRKKRVHFHGFMLDVHKSKLMIWKKWFLSEWIQIVVLILNFLIFSSVKKLDFCLKYCLVSFVLCYNETVLHPELVLQTNSVLPNERSLQADEAFSLSNEDR